MSEYFDGDSRWATEEEAREQRNKEIENSWEIWFGMVGSGYPECEKVEGYI